MKNSQEKEVYLDAIRDTIKAKYDLVEALGIAKNSPQEKEMEQLFLNLEIETKKAIKDDGERSLADLQDALKNPSQQPKNNRILAIAENFQEKLREIIGEDLEMRIGDEGPEFYFDAKEVIESEEKGVESSQANRNPRSARPSFANRLIIVGLDLVASNSLAASSLLFGLAVTTVGAQDDAFGSASSTTTTSTTTTTTSTSTTTTSTRDNTTTQATTTTPTPTTTRTDAINDDSKTTNILVPTLTTAAALLLCVGVFAICCKKRAIGRLNNDSNTDVPFPGTTAATARRGSQQLHSSGSRVSQL